MFCPHIITSKNHSILGLSGFFLILAQATLPMNTLFIEYTHFKLKTTPKKETMPHNCINL